MPRTFTSTEASANTFEIEAANLLKLAAEKFTQAKAALMPDDLRNSPLDPGNEALILRCGEAAVVIDELLVCLADSDIEEDRVAATFANIIQDRSANVARAR